MVYMVGDIGIMIGCYLIARGIEMIIGKTKTMKIVGAILIIIVLLCLHSIITRALSMPSY